MTARAKSGQSQSQTNAFGLTPKQEQFCLFYLKEGNASEAYRQAYDAERMKDTTVHRKAKELLDNGKVAARLDQLRATAAEEAILDRTWVISRLMKVVQIGLNEVKTPAQVKQRKKGEEEKNIEVTQVNLGAATRALETLGKLKELKLFVDTKEHTGPNGGPMQQVSLDPEQLKNMSDEELAALESALGKLSGSSSDSEGGTGSA